MNKLILHRSLGSPYAQKIVTAMDYAELPWESVIAPKGVPRPTQELLVGNYSRRIPILQDGADFYCDTDRIMHQISVLNNRSELSSISLKRSDHEFVSEVESNHFRSMLGSLSPLDFVLGYFKNIPFKDAYAFLKDRVILKRKHPEFDPYSGTSRKVFQVRTTDYFNELDRTLTKVDFFSGTDHPNYVDFSVFTNVWYLWSLNGLKLGKSCNYLKAWLERMNRFHKEKISEISPETSVELAKKSIPKPIPVSLLNSNRIGEYYKFRPNDFLGQITAPIGGILVGEDDYQLIVKREHSEIGEVHVHFPKKCLGACG